MAATLAVAACYMGGGSGSADSPDAAVAKPFAADPPSVYVAKVKNILVGMAPLDSEIQAVQADPSQLGKLVDQWMTYPEYQEKLLTFFELSFQQTQITAVDFTDQTGNNPVSQNQSTAPLIAQNLRESFARTVLALVQQGRPFTDVNTTHAFMMTPAMMEYFAYLDAEHIDDTGKVQDRFAAANMGVNMYIGSAGPISPTESADPKSPNYLHFHNADMPAILTKEVDPACQTDPIVVPAAAHYLHDVIMGTLTGFKVGTKQCTFLGGSANAPQLTATDFNTWKMVTVRAPKAGEQPTRFFDLASLRDPATTELVTVIPRVGFFTTPAFFANWQTNDSNEMRVTLNQTLIVATGTQIDGTDPTIPSSTPGLDSKHTSAAPACYGCHQTLDPMRSILSATYTWDYHDQGDPGLKAQPGLFAYRGYQQPMSTIDDLGSALTAHPLFAPAWVEKLCYYVNSVQCDTNDPEFLRIVKVFTDSGYQWNTVVRELVTSPLTTNTVQTQSAADNGEVVAVSRRDHLCAAMNTRLGLTDVCGLQPGAKSSVITNIVQGLPSDGYGRGTAVPVLPTQPTLFYRAGTENICGALSQLVIDVASPPPGQKHWSSTQPDAAIADFVQLVMAIEPSDARYQPAVALLTQHFADAKKQSGSATAALESTFVVACGAPSALGIGM